MCYIIWIRNISRTRSGAVMQPKPVPSREDAEDSEKRKRGDSMSEVVEKITKEQEEKRLEDFKVIAENWDKFPERVQGKIDGIISMAASAFLKETRKAG